MFTNLIFMYLGIENFWTFLSKSLSLKLNLMSDIVIVYSKKCMSEGKEFSNVKTNVYVIFY